jgi:glycosyltransferase involved in cell wall biosynthesis
MQDQIVVNGKFFNAPPTGVQRVATELLNATRLVLEKDPYALKAELTIMRPPLPASSGRPRGLKAKLRRAISDIIWEQLRLRTAAGDRILLNLCNVGPALHRPSVTMIHDAQVYISPDSYSRAFRLWYKWLQPSLGKSSLRILTVSEYSKTQLVKYGIAKPEKIVVIHNGIDHVLGIRPQDDYVDEIGMRDTPFVLALASTQKHKNIGILFEAFYGPALSATKLLLFGTATRADFEMLGYKVPENVVFLGRISDPQMVAVMRAASAYACPSLTEGFGMPPLEAMALGCAAIIAPAGALHEVCGEHALLADPYRAVEWAHQIERAVANGPEIRSQKVMGQEHALTFTWNRAAQALITVLKEVSAEYPIEQPRS